MPQYWKSWPASQRYQSDAVNAAIYDGNLDMEIFENDREQLAELIRSVLDQVDFDPQTAEKIRVMIANGN